MPSRRTPKTPVKKRRRSPRRQIPDVEAVLLRCTTIERRLEGLEAALNIQAQQMSAIQAQLDHATGGRR
jgi:hypothetical protein